MTDFREYKQPSTAADQQRRWELAEHRTRIMWVVLLAVVIVAGIIFASVR